MGFDTTGTRTLPAQDIRRTRPVGLPGGGFKHRIDWLQTGACNIGEGTAGL